MGTIYIPFFLSDTKFRKLVIAGQKYKLKTDLQILQSYNKPLQNRSPQLCKSIKKRYMRL
jgi:hypothetical protein